MDSEDERGRPPTDRPANNHLNDESQRSAAGNLPRIDAFAVDPAALRAFDLAAQHRAGAVRCIAASVTAAALAAKLAGADHDDVVQAVTAVRRELVHALAGAVAAELADGEWW